MASLLKVQLLTSATITATSAGSTVALQDYHRLPNGYVECTGTVSGTSPTLDIIFQHSPDGTTWATLVSFTQITATNAKEIKLRQAFTAAANPLVVLPFVRASYTIGGTDTPSFAGVSAYLLFEK